MAYKSVYGTLTTGDLVMYFMAMQRGTSYFKELLNSFSSLYEDNLYISNLNTFLGLKNKRTVTAAAEPFPEPITSGIILNNVSFRYPGSTREALRNITMHIEPDTTIALVGDNGAGKTTLVKLLCHLYEADTGEILIDDTNINNIADTAIKSHISVLFQDYVLYHLTVRENIGFGNIDAMHRDERIQQAAIKAGIDDLVASLKKGYETILGKLFDNSEELSIGEWQKLAMARAFFKNAPVIILDEPTSALDPQAEHEVFKQFGEITKGKTSIIVSHRFSTVKMADYIYVLEKETITEHGTHDSLMQLNGKYARMFKLHASNYI
ncbi:MAG: putative ABC transporter ATP-binding protein [Bacteroidetes bacterium ADurb.Bin408]|nr:MAG: putative ABC transporter ATP-binding protein [Bacteroidetes bacterium ADurb.Bin408]